MALATAGAPAGNAFAISREQRQRLQAGDYRPLRFEYDAQAEHDGLPSGCEPDAIYVLGWTSQQRSAVDGIGIVIPPEPSCWLTITKIGRHKSGDWLVRFSVTDLRETVWFLARGNGYTTSRYRAIDDLEAVPPEHLRNRHRKISERDEQLRLERVAAARTEKWRRKRERRRAATRLRAA